MIRYHNIKKPPIVLQIVGKGQTLHPNVSPERTDQRLKEYVKKGKKPEFFTVGELGLDMFIIPTTYFGWKGVTETFKKVQPTFYTYH